MYPRRYRWPAPLLGLLLILQTALHLLWLSPGAHSGQTSIPWMMNRGLPLFDRILEQHAPLSSLLAALGQRVLPFDALGVAIVLNLALVLALTLLVYGVASKLASDARAGALAALAWFWWEPVWGNVLLYFNTLLAFIMLLSLWLWLRTYPLFERSYSSLVLLGLVIGFAPLAKQQGWAAVGLMGLFILFTERARWRALIPFGIAALLPSAAVFGSLLIQGSADAYIYWNWTFNFSGLMDNVPPDGDFLRKLLLPNVLVPGFALICLKNWRERMIPMPTSSEMLNRDLGPSRGIPTSYSAARERASAPDAVPSDLFPKITLSEMSHRGAELRGVPEDDELELPRARRTRPGGTNRPRDAGLQGSLLLILFYVAGLVLLYPRAGEVAAMSHIPLAAVMTGVALLAILTGLPRYLKLFEEGQMALSGLLLALAAGWFITGIASYVPTQLGPGAHPGWDEFAELNTELQILSAPGDTLFVLPETDSTPQLHPLTEMLPPGTWIKGWRWYLDPATGARQQLLSEWQNNPPDWVVIFPDLLSAGQPTIMPLLDFVEARYTLAAEIEDVFLHGPALIYELEPAP